MDSINIRETDSASYLHAIEHFGFGIYLDPIDVNGYNKGITNLVNLISSGGRLYISFPIGQRDKVFFQRSQKF